MFISFHFIFCSSKIFPFDWTHSLFICLFFLLKISKEKLDFNIGLNQFRVGQNYFDSFVISFPSTTTTTTTSSSSLSSSTTKSKSKTKSTSKYQKLESIEIVFHPPKTPKFNVMFNPERCIVKKVWLCFVFLCFFFLSFLFWCLMFIELNWTRINQLKWLWVWLWTWQQKQKWQLELNSQVVFSFPFLFVFLFVDIEMKNPSNFWKKSWNGWLIDWSWIFHWWYLIVIRKIDVVFIVVELKVHAFLIEKISSELSPLIDIDEIHIDNTKIVGDGAYGTVYRGTVCFLYLTISFSFKQTNKQTNKLNNWLNNRSFLFYFQKIDWQLFSFFFEVSWTRCCSENVENPRSSWRDDWWVWSRNWFDDQTSS